MNGEMLKKSILQYAIEGKLVEQDDREESAKILLEKIRAEKEKLIEEKKIKRNKNESFIYRKNGSFYEKKGKEEVCIDDELPFEIPKSWEWARFGSVFDVRDGTHDTPKYVKNGIPLVTSKNLKNGNIDFSTCKFISEEDHNKIILRSKVDCNDILFAMIGSIGNPVLCNCTTEFSIKNVALFKKYYEQQSMNYLYYFLIYSTDIMKKRASGGLQPFVSLKFLRNFLIPIPPLEEQKRIVAKIEELLPLIEDYKIANEELTELNKKLPERLKKSVLNYAIEGKLVEQDDREESAKILLEKIREEKEKLIKEKKIKRNKNESIIYRKNGSFYEQKGKEEVCIDDELPFKIPKSWEWARLGDIGIWKSGLTPSRSKSEYYNGNIHWLKTGDLNDSYIETTSECITDLAVKETKIKINPIDSVLIAMYGATIGKIGLLKIESATNQACCSCKCYGDFYNLYLFYYLLCSRAYLIKLGAGGAQPNISKEKIINFLIPIPPFEEQKRIVEKIEEVLGLIEKLN